MRGTRILTAVAVSTLWATGCSGAEPVPSGRFPLATALHTASVPQGWMPAAPSANPAIDELEAAGEIIGTWTTESGATITLALVKDTSLLPSTLSANLLAETTGVPADPSTYSRSRTETSAGGFPVATLWTDLLVNGVPAPIAVGAVDLGADVFVAAATAKSAPETVVNAVSTATNSVRTNN